MGAGSRGSCKLCSSKYASAINSMIAAGKKHTEVLKTIKGIDEKEYWTFPTFRAHVLHITHPLVTAVEEAQKNPVVVPKTTHGALEAIRDIAMRNAAAHPEDITVDHGLKAMSILESSKRPAEHIFLILAKLMQAPVGDQTDTIEGVYHDVSVAATEGGLNA